MISKSIQFRVRYGETDQMGFVYHGNYPAYFEMGRIEWLRAIGMSYKEMEKKGTMLPVKELCIQYHKPAVYDDLLTLTTRITERPSVRITFEYELRNEAGELLTTAQTTLAFVNQETSRPTRPPKAFLEAFDRNSDA
jgi:acyl-CoA thioester hydrolase